MTVYCRHKKGKHSVTRDGASLVFIDGVAEVPDAIAAKLITIRGYSDKPLPEESIAAPAPAPAPASPEIKEEPNVKEEPKAAEPAPAPAPAPEPGKKMRGRPPRRKKEAE